MGNLSCAELSSTMWDKDHVTPFFSVGDIISSRKKEANADPILPGMKELEIFTTISQENTVTTIPSSDKFS